MSTSVLRVESCGPNGLRGVRRRLPRQFVEQSQRKRAAKGSGKGDKIEFTITPKVRAYMDWFAQLFPERTRPVKKKETDGDGARPNALLLLYFTRPRGLVLFWGFMRFHELSARATAAWVRPRYHIHGLINGMS